MDIFARGMYKSYRNGFLGIKESKIYQNLSKSLTFIPILSIIYFRFIHFQHYYGGNMESKNLSMQWMRVRDDLKKGYGELESGRYNFAQIVFDKVISEDENCGSAYLGKALAESEQKSLTSAFEHNLMGDIYRKLFFTSDKICSAVLSDTELAQKIFEYGYNSTESLDPENALIILKFLEKNNYKDATSRIYMYESYAELEVKAQKYQWEYKEKIDTEFPVAPIDEEPLPEGLKHLITEEEAAKKYPGILDYLKQIDFLYRAAQVAKKPKETKVSDWMSTTNWIIFGILVYFFWPAAVIYILYRYNKYGKPDAPKAKKGDFADHVQMTFYEDDFRRVTKRYGELCEELRFTLETMLGEETDTFESEASSLRFMMGKSKEVLDKYSRI